jgi:hypothetical protein
MQCTVSSNELPLPAQDALCYMINIGLCFTSLSLGKTLINGALIQSAVHNVESL